MKKPLQLLTALIVSCMPFTTQAQEETPPYVIFISENTPAKDAIEQVIINEYNAGIIEDLRVNNFAVWEAESAKPSSERFTSYTASAWRNLPATFRNTRYAEYQAALNLADDDPADKGFTDLLEANGYEVYRSGTIVEQDPITGATSYDHEFWGDIGEAYSATGDYRLSQEQIDFLSAADLIIMSKDVTPNRYSAGGREAGQASTVLIDQWNAIPVPIIAMDEVLMGTMEFGSWGWGWSYGFSYKPNGIQAYDRRDIVGEDRFVFTDLRPVLNTSDSTLLAGVSTVDDDRVPIYLDTAEFPMLPQHQRKFSNNKNYNYPSHVKLILEMEYPSFVVTEVGDIPTRDPILVEFPKNVATFTPQDGVPVVERVAIPSETRLYFAAGMGAGLYNLSATGEKILLNAVGKYTGTVPVVDDTWYGYTIDENGWIDSGSWLNGLLYVNEDPWVYTPAFGKYLYFPDASGWIYVPR